MYDEYDSSISTNSISKFKGTITQSPKCLDTFYPIWLNRTLAEKVTEQKMELIVEESFYSFILLHPQFHHTTRSHNGR